MNIQLTYQPTATELAKASSLFIEKKPFLQFVVLMMNGVAVILIFLMIVKLWLATLSLQDISTVIVALIWIFGRRPFNEWLLLRKMKKSPVIDKPITITLSDNGIIWSGNTLKQGNLSWAHIRYLMEAQNGFILPFGSTKFLWIPFSAFSQSDMIDTVRAFLKERNITLRHFPKWQC